MSFGKEQNFMPDKILIVDDETEIADLIEAVMGTFVCGRMNLS